MTAQWLFIAVSLFGGPPSTADAYTDGGLAAGTYYYWLKARNGSGVESASVATGAVTVT